MAATGERAGDQMASGSSAPPDPPLALPGQGVLPAGATGFAAAPLALGARGARDAAGRPPTFSLVMSTIGRSAEVELFFQSLVAQTYQDFEVIVVDQNKDDRVRSLCDRYPGLDILYMTSPPGASKGRNVGLEFARGEILAFPDDDCVYAPCVLERVKKLIDDGTGDFVMAKSLDIGDTSAALREPVAAMPILHSKPLNKYSLWLRGTTYVIFLTRPFAVAVGAFDERMGGGSGTPYGSGEDADYIVRAFFAGARMVRCDDVRIAHPAPDFSDEKLAEKTYTYGVGRRFVLQKHGFGPLFTALNVMWPAVHYVRNISDAKMRYYFMQMLKGRMKRPHPQHLA